MLQMTNANNAMQESLLNEVSNHTYVALFKESI